MAHGDARERKWRGGNWRMERVASTLHTTSEHGVSSITTADAHTSAASSRLNWRPRRFKWTRPFRRKTKYGFCARAITFQTQSTYPKYWPVWTSAIAVLVKFLNNFQCVVRETGEVNSEFWWGDPREGDYLKDASVYGKMILKWIFMTWDGEALIGLIWVRTGTDGGCLWILTYSMDQSPSWEANRVCS